jgi:hypothetical protein
LSENGCPHRHILAASRLRRHFFTGLLPGPVKKSFLAKAKSFKNRRTSVSGVNYVLCAGPATVELNEHLFLLAHSRVLCDKKVAPKQLMN